MTVPNSFNTKTYQLNGSATEFATEFLFFTDAQISAYLVLDGVTTPLVQGVDYSVSGAGEPGGGIVTYPISGPPDDVSDLTLERLLPIIQPTSLRNQGAYFPENVEQAIDESRMIDQQQQEQIGRSLKKKKGSDNYDAGGDRIANVGTPVDAGDATNKGYVDESFGRAVTAVEEAEAQAGYSREWAQSQEPISIAAGGNGSSDHSSLFWAGVAEQVIATFDSSSNLPSSQIFAVGGATQSVDLGNPELHPDGLQVYIDGVYQFTSTWDLTLGILTPTSGSWPGDGIVQNMEVIVDSTTAMSFDVPSNGSVTNQKIANSAVSYEKLDDNLQSRVDSSTALSSDTPFGVGGIRVLRGEEYDAHYGLENGWIIFPSGKWVLIYRKGTDHGIRDGSEVRAADSYDNGATLVNDRVIYTNPLSDARPNKPRILGNGRAGFFVNRQDEGTTHFSPLVIVSDDEFVTWEEKTIPLSPPYTFSSTGGMIDFPTSQGGDDETGFIAYGYAVSGGYDAIYTVDNWETHTVVGGIATFSAPITSLSEWSGARIGTQDKWIFYLRNQDSGGWRDEAACFVTTNLLNWGAAIPSGINLGGNPPSAFFDDATNMYHFIGFGRTGRGIDGLDHHMLIASADGDDLYAANGDWSALSPAVNWKVVAPVPNWATGYISEVKFGDTWVGTFVAGEPGLAGAERSALMMIGNFIPSGTDAAKVIDVFQWNSTVKEIRAGFSSVTRPAARAVISASVDSVRDGILTENFGSTTRTHWAIRNANGQIGSVTAGGSSTSYNTTSDGQLKVNRKPIEEEVDIDLAFDNLAPLAYDWLNEEGIATGERGCGLIAQDVAALLPGVVQQGKGSPGDEDYEPWQVDYSKLVVFLVAKIQKMDKEISRLKGDK